jgi:hypoxanthine phosphoribosyltransferase
MMGQPAVLFDEATIARRVRELGAEIARACPGRELSVVGRMKSAFVFMADLVRAIPLDLRCHFMQTGQEGGGAARTDLVFSTESSYEGRDILLVESIIDTGITQSFLFDHLEERRPRSVKVCTLIDRPGERKVDLRPDWAAFTLTAPPADGFIVGYGLDLGERYRGLGYLGLLPRAGETEGGRSA